MANSHALKYLETITCKYAVKLKVLISTDVECNFCQNIAIYTGYRLFVCGSFSLTFISRQMYLPHFV